MKSGAPLIHLTARNTFNSSSHSLFNTSKVEVKNIRGTACISVLIKEGKRRNVSRDKHGMIHAGWSLLASTFGDIPSGLYLTPTGFSGLLAGEFDPAERCFSPFMHLFSGSMEIILGSWYNVGSMGMWQCSAHS